MVSPSSPMTESQAKIVITGASGFIGSALVPELRKRGHEVIEASRKHLPDHDYRRLSPQPDAVLVHLAEPRDLQVAEVEGEGHFFKVTGVCAALVEMEWRHIVYVSSAVVYGHASDTIHDTKDHVSPLNVYSRTKLACEEMVSAKGGTIVRPSNIYGPGMATNNVVSHILDQIPGSDPLYLQAVTPVRDFLWISDTAKGLAAAIERRPSGIFNLGNGVSISVGQLAGLALRIAGEGYRPVVATKPQDMLSQLHLDISGSVQALDWVPEVPIDQGLCILLDQRREADSLGTGQG